MPGVLLRRLLCLSLVLAAVHPARAGELYTLGGLTWHGGTDDRSYAWQLEFAEPVAEHAALSVSYLNEGHFPQHHRDGHSVQLWARTALVDPRLSVAAGAGPYFYYDTTDASGNGARNHHAFGALGSVAATCDVDTHWLFQLRGNWAWTDSSIDTATLLIGVGYRFQAPAGGSVSAETREPARQPLQNELTVFGGQSILNTFHSEVSPAVSVEYRTTVWRFVEWTGAWLYEGPHESRGYRRNGLLTELWLTRVVPTHHVSLWRRRRSVRRREPWRRPSARCR